MAKTSTILWEKFLDGYFCSAHPLTGNRPCDEGTVCDQCSADWVDEAYKNFCKDSGRVILRLHYADGSTLDLGLDIFADDHPLEKFLAELDPTTRVTGHVVG